MKKTLIIMLLILMVAAPAVMPAATNTATNGWLQPVQQLFSVVLMVFGVPLLIKLGRKLGVTVDEQLATDAINALINIIVNIDLGSTVTGQAKKKMAVSLAKQQLTNAQQDVLIKKYGSLEAAVQLAFERSSLNKTK